MPLSNEHTYLSVTTPFGAQKLLLRRFDGEERVSAPFLFHLEMVAEDNSLDFKTIVGKAAHIEVSLADDDTRYIHGLVTRFVQGGTDQRLTTYYADLEPWLAMLKLTANCRIFQAKPLPDILTTVFNDLGYTDFKNSLKGTYAAREYCVQYRESAFEFVSRLMEEAGIFYYFEHEAGKHVLVLADDADTHPPCPGRPTASYRPELQEPWPEENVVTSLTLTEEVRSGKVGLEDYNFEMPSTELLVEADGGNPLRVFDYPGRYAKKDEGEALANLRMQALEARETRIQGSGSCRGMTSGHSFTLSDHHRDSANAEYKLLWLSHSASHERYQNSFEAIPVKTPYRPRIETRKPIIPGAQTAVVVGKAGEEIWTDKYGRIKVQFHWDQLGKNDENSSCWIRVAQGWAGKSWGAFFLPRIGQEVVVTFLEGDPDRPLVTGSVYNAEQTAPYALPDNMTRSTIKSNSSKGGEGYNEIRYEDKKDAEEIYVFAQKDMNITVKHDRTKTVLNDEVITIKKNRTVTIEEENESLTVKKGNRTIKVDKGDETHSVKGARTLTITKAESHTNEDNFTQEVTKNFVLKVKGDITIEATGAISIKSGKDYSVDAGMNLVAKAKMELKNDAGMNLTNSAKMQLTSKAGLSMNIDGGMQLSSKASVMQALEAGAMLSVKGAIVKIN